MARARARGGSRTTGGNKFSVKAMHNELDAVLARLKKSKAPGADALRKKVQKLRDDTVCPQNMVLDLSK